MCDDILTHVVIEQVEVMLYTQKSENIVTDSPGYCGKEIIK